MRIIIDTNILISTAIADSNPEKVILFVAENDEFKWIVSNDILNEYKTVLARKKFKLSSQQLQRWFQVLDDLTVLMKVDVDIDFPRDRKDEAFLCCAITADADYLITGDKDFSEAQKLIDTKIFSAYEFKKKMNLTD